MKLTLSSAILAPVAVFAFSLFSHSQTLASDDTFIAQAKNLPASTIERRLGSATFGSWVRSLSHKDSPAKWKIRPCGHEEGIPDGDNKRSVCMNISGRIAADVTFQIYVDFATIKNGHIVSPLVRYLFVGGENVEGGAEYDKLSSMRAQLIIINKALTSFDPNDGDFQPSADTKQFEGVSEILVETKDYNSKGIPIPIKTRGVLYANNGGYKMFGIIFDGKRLAFATAVHKGVSFKFDGTIENLKVNAHGTYTRDVILKGHIVKIVNGKKVSESDITFNYEAFPGC